MRPAARHAMTRPKLAAGLPTRPPLTPEELAQLRTEGRELARAVDRATATMDRPDGEMLAVRVR